MNDSDAFYLVASTPGTKPEPLIKDLILSSEELALPDISVSLVSQEGSTTDVAGHRMQSSVSVSDPRMDVRLRADEPDIPQGGLGDIISRTDDIALPHQKILPVKKNMPHLGS